jgi:hypothetical protein
MSGDDEKRDNVVSLADKTDDNRFITPHDMLLVVADDIKKGHITPKRMVVLMLDDSDGMYDTDFRMANISTSQSLALCSMMQSLFAMRLAGFIDDDEG